MARKKILWLCSWYPDKTEPFNGDFIQRHAQAAALYNDIYVIHVAGDIAKDAKEVTQVLNPTDGLTENIIYYKKPSFFWGRIFSHYRWLVLSRKAIRQYVKENGKPELVHIHIPIRAGISGLWVKKKYNIPYVVTEHWGIYNDIEIYNYKNKSAAFKKWTKRILSKAAALISVSNYLAEGMNRLVMKKEYTVIPNTVNTDLFYYKEQTNASFTFIHVSNIVPLKNVEGILRAFALVLQQKHTAKLVIAGDSNPDIRLVANQLDIPAANISFRGEIPYQQVASEMQQSQCLVLFSNIENSPCVIGEALCCGLPVIATNVGGIPELVDTTNAILINPKDEEALAAAMVDMMNNYQQYNCKKIAEDAAGKFSYPVIGGQLDAVYTAVITNKI